MKTLNVVVGFLCLGTASFLAGREITRKPTVRWFNEDSKAYNAYKQAVWKTNTSTFNPRTRQNENFVFQIGTPTNWFAVELGFRDDGVVVWRKRLPNNPVKE